MDPGWAILHGSAVKVLGRDLDAKDSCLTEVTEYFVEVSLDKKKNVRALA